MRYRAPNHHLLLALSPCIASHAWDLTTNRAHDAATVTFPSKHVHGFLDQRGDTSSGQNVKEGEIDVPSTGEPFSDGRERLVRIGGSEAMSWWLWIWWMMCYQDRDSCRVSGRESS